LLENAIYHGVELLPEGGKIIVCGRRDGNFLVISISNPKAANKSRTTDGNKMALANIRQRFELAYRNRGSVDIEDTDTSYSVTLRFPIDESRS
jgi:two-component system sensor histidine kinase AlgZ